MKIEKAKFIQPYLKDITLASILILLALIFYEKPSIEIRETQKQTVNFTSKNSTEVLQRAEDDSSESQKSISIFKEENVNEASEIKQPTFKEVLFGEQHGKIRLIAITGTEKNKKALILDHNNSLRTFRKGEKTEDDIIVVDISDTSIKFKSGSKIKELFLYKKEDYFKPPAKAIQKPKQEPIEESEEVEEEEPAKMKKLGKGRIR